MLTANLKILALAFLFGLGCGVVGTLLRLVGM